MARTTITDTDGNEITLADVLPEFTTEGPISGPAWADSILPDPFA